MIIDSFLVGCQAWFIQDGTAFTLPAPGGVVARESKPQTGPAIDPAFIALGAIESATATIASEQTKLWMPAPGRLVLKDVRENKTELSYKLTINDLQPLAIQAFYRAAAILGGDQTQFVPLSAEAPRGWLHLQKYDSTDAIWLVLDLYVRMAVKEMKFDGKPTMFDPEIFVLYSSQNTGATA